MFSVIIPFREEDKEPSRVNSFNFIKKFWEYNYDCEVVVSDSNTTLFNRSQARNLGVDKASFDNLVLCDADTFPDVTSIPTAFSKIEEGSGWVLPYVRYYRLSREFSSQVIEEKINFISKPYYDIKFVKNCWAGVICLNKTMFEQAGGYNEDYSGWGFEDYEFRDKLDKHVGRHLRLPGSVYHLWHEVEEGTTDDSSTFMSNKLLYDRSRLK